MGHWTQPLIALILMKIAITTAAAVVASQALPDCDEWCGDMQIPYPFGVRKGCYLNETFLVTCNKTTNPPKAFLKDTNISVTNISISGELHMMQPIVRDCYKHVDGPLLPNEANLTVPAAFPIAYERNKFIAIGCNTFGLIGGVVDGSAYVSGCVSMCTNDSKKADGACVGNGCCQLEIPRGLSDLILSVGSLLNHTDAMDFNPCGYAFVVGDEGFQFSTNYITSFDDVEVEVVSGWAIGNDTNFVCGLNSVRNSSFSDDGSEFRCECFDGFEGNPYLPRGCQDIDECKDERLNNCKYKNKCINTIGNYTCDCPKNFKGDGRHGGEGCIRDVKAFTPIIIGGYGTVYKGILHDGLAVAIKKSKLVDQSQTDQFINELIVLSQINHRNVVRLLGCCLETQVPLLVYEFVTNGTLFDRIHDKANHVSLSWETRLKIASETAGVLSYLHSSTSTPIIHRDIKTTNILLDDNYTAKVSDFGASKLVPMDQTQLSTMVQGTLGYLDPEYLLTSELTEKSDVYSFGIVVLELITGKKAVSFDGPEAERNLAMYVLCAMKEDRLEEIVERRMVREANFEQIREATKLATKCVRIKGEERPCMKEVAMELEGLRLMQGEHSWVNMNLSNADEMICLLDHVASDPSHFVESTSLNNSVGDSLKARILSHIHHGR
ncbi:wall-associated receptor kinase-like 8 isoform X2 [Cucurbita moschata]|uniref:Wall-associated receptor kinase-like 8 isoform X2 n=1 Tax=Cucurbita moschata TaxID=3662 RepID=A0A6J1FG68_CUCMO|nr:wall-associated receptor kinase-like 8 isoform X2 [Cucurbita moschata]